MRKAEQIVIAGIPIQVVRKRIKTMYLRVHAPDERVTVSAPRSMSDAEIERFVSSRIDWIEKKLAKIRERQYEAATDAAEHAMYVWGKKYPIEVKEHTRYGIRVNGDCILFNVKHGSTLQQQRAWIREWYREQLSEAVEKILPEIEHRMGVKCNEWRTKNMKTRWGTCNVERKRIWINVQLAKYEPECLEYVVVHELAHLIDRTHGPGFKAVMDKNLPNWRQIRAKLKQPKETAYF